MACECGCGYVGEDELVQYLLEEALMTALELQEARSEAEGLEQLAALQPLQRSLERRDRALRQINAGGA